LHFNAHTAEGLTSRSNVKKCPKNILITLLQERHRTGQMQQETACSAHFNAD
jgi:hypothetical protein